MTKRFASVLILSSALAAAVASCGEEPFTRADANKDGRVSLAEAKAVNAKLSDKQFKSLDLNGDGLLDRVEFTGRARGTDPSKRDSGPMKRG